MTSSPEAAPPAPSAWDVQADLEQLDLGPIPSIPSLGELQALHVRLRDAREWEWEEMPGFKRRLPWLYLEDGCYLRAAKASEKLRQWGMPAPSQILAFGDLAPIEAPELGQSTGASWWFHVAPALRVGEKTYVLDPALDARAPIELHDWVRRISPDPSSVKLSVCDSGAVNPDDPCRGEQARWDEQDEAMALQDFLALEWEAMASRPDLDPASVLGERPPWGG